MYNIIYIIVPGVFSVGIFSLRLALVMKRLPVLGVLIYWSNSILRLR